MRMYACVRIYAYMHVCCTQEDQYARWMAAFRLASKGRTMADSSYEGEVRSIASLLSMQRPAPPSPLPAPNDTNFTPENYIAPRFFRKMKSGKQVGGLTGSRPRLLFD